MKFVEGTCTEVWSNGIRLGIILEEWFYPAANVQIAPEELIKIANRMAPPIVLKVRDGEIVGDNILRESLDDAVSRSLNNEDKT